MASKLHSCWKKPHLTTLTLEASILQSYMMIFTCQDISAWQFKRLLACSKSDLNQRNFTLLDWASSRPSSIAHDSAGTEE